MRITDLSVSSLFWFEKNLCSVVQKQRGPLFSVGGVNLSKRSTFNLYISPAVDLSLPKSIEPDLLKWPTHFIYWLLKSELNYFRQINYQHENRYRVPHTAAGANAQNARRRLLDTQRARQKDKIYGDFSQLFDAVRTEAAKKFRNYPYENSLANPNPTIVSEFIKSPEETMKKRNLAADEAINKTLLLARQEFFSKLKEPRKKSRRRVPAVNGNPRLKPRCRELDSTYAKEIKDELLKKYGSSFSELTKLISLAEKLPEPYGTLAFTSRRQKYFNHFRREPNISLVPLVLYLAEKCKDPGHIATSNVGAKEFTINLFAKSPSTTLCNLSNNSFFNAVDTVCTKADLSLPFLSENLERMLKTSRKNGLRSVPTVVERGRVDFYFPGASVDDSNMCPKPLGWPLSYVGRIGTPFEEAALQGKMNKNSYDFLSWFYTQFSATEEEEFKRGLFNHRNLNNLDFVIEGKENNFLRKSGKHSSREKIFECPECCSAIYNLWYRG